jgi:hypothetical protein
MVVPHVLDQLVVVVRRLRVVQTNLGEGNGHKMLIRVHAETEPFVLVRHRGSLLVRHWGGLLSSSRRRLVQDKKRLRSTRTVANFGHIGLAGHIVAERPLVAETRHRRFVLD